MVTDAGEDTIYICDECSIAINDEIIEVQKVCPVCGKDKFRKEKAIEVGNIFELKNKFTEPFDFKFKDSDGKDKIIQMGCYGIGLGRVMGAVVEASSDSLGIIWPDSIAPFKLHLIDLSGKKGGEEAKKKAEEIYTKLTEKGVSVLYDDRNSTAGEKFSDSDLIGIPKRIIVSQRGLEEGRLEIKDRKTGEVKMITEKELFEMF